MIGKDLIEGYGLATVDLLNEPETTEIDRLERTVDGLLESVVPEPTGESMATWRLESGVEVEVTRDITIDSSPLLTEESATYNINISHGSDDGPEDGLMETIQYFLYLPMKGARTTGAEFSRNYSVYIPEMISPTSEHHVGKTVDEMAAWRAESQEQLIAKMTGAVDEEDTPISTNDVGMLMALLQEKKGYSHNPLQQFREGTLDGDSIPSNQQIEALLRLMDEVVDGGRVEYRRKLTRYIASDKPDEEIVLQITKDDSERGAYFEPSEWLLGRIATWEITLSVGARREPFYDQFRLSRLENDELEVDNRTLVKPPVEVLPTLLDPELPGVTEDEGAESLDMFDLFDEEAADDFITQLRRHDADYHLRQATAKKLGIDRVNASHVAWFKNLLDLA